VIILYTALYREWRPQTFKDVVGQKHITTTLQNEILNNRIGHAYLLCGTRGTGKTTTAKIFAKALNCENLIDGEPCNECSMCKSINSGICIDVTELDAASNNGVDNIRDIIEDVQYPPHEAKYKVYIMDEVHMLSQGAVNAFLKTLEEPPKNVVFILATTDPQKLPITILSRCQRFDFKRIKNEDIFLRLKEIIDAQDIDADDNSLNLIAKVADGAMRDSLSVLDQAIAMGDGKVNYDTVINMLGLVTSESLINLTDTIINKDIEKAMRTIDEVVLSGKDCYSFIKDLIIHFRNLMIAKVSVNPQEVIDMSSENLIKVQEQAHKIPLEEIMRCIRVLQEAEEKSKWSKQTRIYLELAVIKICKVEYDTSKEVLISRINRLEDIIKSGKINVATPKAVQNNEIVKTKNDRIINSINNRSKQEITDENIEEINTETNLTLDIIKKQWSDILDTLKSRRLMIVYASLMTGKVSDYKNGIITIRYEEQFAFNKQRLEKEDNRQAVNDVFSEILKEHVKVRYIVDSQKVEANNEDMLKSAFGEDMVEIIDE
jgi:DNA polymerase-3 subunit gamma/tau